VKRRTRPLLILCLIAGSCSSSADVAYEEISADLRFDATSDVESTDSPTTSTGASATATEDPSTTEASTSTTDTTDATTSTTGEPTPTTAAGPTTTKAPPPAGSGGGSPKVDPFDIYTGILGFFSPDKLVTPAMGSVPSAEPGTFPLTGLAGSSPNRPAVVVKIDNGSKARPQEGLNKADIVIEEEVEWGITRLAAIFHSNQAEVGPVRSGRSTDISFLNSLGKPALAYSGANDVIDALLLMQPNVQNFSAARSSAYWRKSGRPAPSNLWANTSSFTQAASGGAPPPQFDFRPAGTPAPTGAATGSISIRYPSASIGWSWDGSAWLRTQDGKAHKTNGAQISASNVVVIEARVVGTGLVDSAGGVVPEVVWLGNGKAIVFTDGKRIEATWTRSTLRSQSVLTDSTGAVIELTPGRTWVELTSAGSTSSS
jgi:hypothetical protein